MCVGNRREEALCRLREGLGAGRTGPEMPPAEQRQAGAVARLEAENAALRAESAKLRQQLEELERQVGLDSSNSSKTPSSDGRRKPPARRRKRSLQPAGQVGRAAGAQGPHAAPEHIKEHWPEHCGSSGTTLAGVGTEGERC